MADNSQTGFSALSKMALAVTAPARLLGSLAKVPLRARKRPTWNVRYEAAIMFLRSSSANLPRSIPMLRTLTDTSIPGVLLPRGVLRAKETLPGGLVLEWVWPARLTPNLRQQFLSSSGKVADACLRDGAWRAAVVRGPTVLYLHGGAYCLCTQGTHRDLVMRLCLETNCVVALPDYRRPPESPITDAVHDAVLSYGHMLHEVGVPPGRVAFAGDSAGAALAVLALVALRDRALAPSSPSSPTPTGETSGPPTQYWPANPDAPAPPLPAAAMLCSPWVDLIIGSHDERPSTWRNAPVDYLPEDLIDLFARCACGEAGEAGEAAAPPPGLAAAPAPAAAPAAAPAPAAAAAAPALTRDDPRCSPLHASLDGLPPLLIHAGECEVLLDQQVAFARKAAAAGVSVELRVWRDLCHVPWLFCFAHATCRASLCHAAAFLFAHTRASAVALAAAPAAPAGAAAVAADGECSGPWLAIDVHEVVEGPQAGKGGAPKLRVEIVRATTTASPDASSAAVPTAASASAAAPAAAAPDVPAAPATFNPGTATWAGSCSASRPVSMPRQPAGNGVRTTEWGDVVASSHGKEGELRCAWEARGLDSVVETPLATAAAGVVEAPDAPSADDAAAAMWLDTCGWWVEGEQHHRRVSGDGGGGDATAAATGPNGGAGTVVVLEVAVLQGVLLGADAVRSEAVVTLPATAMGRRICLGLREAATAGRAERRPCGWLSCTVHVMRDRAVGLVPAGTTVPAHLASPQRPPSADAGAAASYTYQPCASLVTDFLQ